MGQNRKKSHHKPHARQTKIQIEKEREQCGRIREHQHWYIAFWLLYRGYNRDIFKDMIKGECESCSTLRAVVQALWCFVKSHWHEPEGKRGKQENRWLGTGSWKELNGCLYYWTLRNDRMSSTWPSSYWIISQARCHSRLPGKGTKLFDHCLMCLSDFSICLSRLQQKHHGPHSSKQ